MKRWLNINMFVMALFALVLASCNENENPLDPGPSAPNAPTAVMAKSNSTTSVGLMWVAATTGDAATGYIVEYNEVGTATKLTKTVTGGSTTSTVIDGLTNGTRYEFAVRATNATGQSAASAPVVWAPADVRSSTIRLYSSRNTANGSGASIVTGQQLRVAQGSQWDICFDDKDGRPLIGSPGVSGYVDNSFNFIGAPSQSAKTVSIDTNLSNAKSVPTASTIGDIYYTSSLDNGANFTEALYNLADSRIDPTKHFAFTVRIRVNSTTVNFARVLVRSNGTGFVNGTGADSYIEIETSYQSVTNVPHAIMQRLFPERPKVVAAGSNVR
jgi:hypothetical protein